MKRVVPILLLFTLTACGLLKGDNKEKPPGKIVFSTLEAEDGHFQLFVMNTDGSDQQQLTHFENDRAVQPAWSPDGRQIVFVTSLRYSTAGGSLYLMNADGTNIRPMKERPGSTIVTPGSHPRWSPDGTKIAFDWCRNCESGGNNYEIYVYDLEQDTVIQLTDHTASDTRPVWGEKGHKIAFVSERDYPNVNGSDIYLMDIEGNNITRLTKTGNAGRPVWSFKLQYLLYWSNDRIYKYNFPDSTISSLSIFLGRNIGLRPLDISQDENWLLIHTFSYVSPSDNHSLTILNLKDDKMKKLASNKNFNGADWYVPMDH